jgi:hypothetical protein
METLTTDPTFRTISILNVNDQPPIGNKFVGIPGNSS